VRALFVLIASCLLVAAVPAAPQDRVETAVEGLTLDAPPSLDGIAAVVQQIDLARLADDLHQAGLALPRRLDVALLPDDAPLARRTPDWIVGLASGTSDIVIFPQRVLPYPHDSIESVFRHEVVHLALATRANDQPLPRWFHEGVAMSVDTGWGASGQARLLFAMIGNPGVADLSRLFATGAQSESSQAYGLSAALVADVRRRHGSAVPGAIATHVGLGVPFDLAFRMETGERPDEAAALAWATYRRWTGWIPAATGSTALWGLILALSFLAFAVRRRRRARRAWLSDEDD
jgi:hypothetical protein